MGRLILKSTLYFFLQDHFFTPAVFGEIIYDNFLFDIPKILDLCVLFGKGNSQLLHKMIGELIENISSWSSCSIEFVI